MNEIALCLPKGDNLGRVSNILQEINFPIEGYTPNNRDYRPYVSHNGIRAKIFAEKDVVIQVAAGNYSFGFCGLDWIEELCIKFPHANVGILKKFGKTSKEIYACCHIDEKKSINDYKVDGSKLRIVSEYAHLAENFAIQKRFPNYNIFSAWGASEAYPPEHAEIVILAAKNENDLKGLNLRPIEKILDVELCLVVNKKHYESENLSGFLNYLGEKKW